MQEQDAQMILGEETGAQGKETAVLPPMLQWVRDRWLEGLAPALRVATVQREDALRAVWEQELEWWKRERGLRGDSLRKPITQVRNAIRTLPLHEENCWVNPQGEREHIGLRVCNLAEGEWVSLNDRSRAATQDRLSQMRLVRDPEGVVQRAVALLLSDEWTDLVVGLALTTGRRLAEMLKTGTFTLKEPYTVWFEGQVKGRGREIGRYEIPTLARAYLVVDAIDKLRRLLDCRALEIEQVSQRYSKAVNDTLERIYGASIPARSDRDRITVHTLRALYASIAVLWFAPDTESEVNYKARIQGHSFILTPEGSEGMDEEQLEAVRLNYASHANYDDYRLADEQGRLDGRHGIKLGLPGVTVLDALRPLQAAAEDGGASLPPSRRQKKRSKSPVENKTGRAPFSATIQTRAWGNDLLAELQQQLHRPLKDDELLRRAFAAYVASLAGQRVSQETHATFSLDLLDVDEQTKAVLQQGMMLSGATDLLSFLVAAGEREARQLVSQAKRHDPTQYAGVMTAELAKIKVPEASQERFRRAVHTLMAWNADHRPLERWYITVLPIQKLVGGRKEAIKAYLDAHQQEIEEHHQALGIVPLANRKSEAIEDVVKVPDEPTAFPWGYATTPDEAEK